MQKAFVTEISAPRGVISARLKQWKTLNPEREKKEEQLTFPVIKPAHAFHFRGFQRQC